MAKQYPETITAEELAALPQLQYPGRKIVIVDSVRDAFVVCEKLQEAQLLGFDTETRPSFKKGVSYKIALMQISDGDTCYLFRLNMIGIPQCLNSVLGNENIIKVGLSLGDDFRQIRRTKNVELKGFVDIQKMVGNFGIKELGLKKIYAIIFGKKISKAQQLTNWEAKELTAEQQRYAAIDAWACVDIYNELSKA